MASFTDEIVNFTPYRPENPVEAMLQVGITKQQQYDQGLQKVQTYVDTISSLDVQKQEIKDYIQTKLSTLHQNLNNVSGDFSDQRLVTQIGGAASKIANDPIVQNGIIAANSIRSGFANIEAARKAGKSNPNNEVFFTDAVAKWQNDGQVDTKFNGQYSEYFDIVGEVRKVFKDLTGGQELPPSFSINNLKKDENGRPIFDLNLASEMVLMEGVSVDRIQHAIDLVMQNGNAQRQLNIDGYAKYRGVQAPQMFDAIVGSTQRQLDVYNETIKAAQSKLGGSTVGDKEELLKVINHYTEVSKRLVANSDNLIAGLATNPDGVKAQLVEQDLRADLTGALAYQKIVESPLWNQNLELQKFRLSQDQFTFNQFDADRKFQLDQFKAETDRLKSDEDKKSKEPANYIGNLPTPNTAGQAGSESFYKLKSDALSKATRASREALSEYASLTQQISPFVFDAQANEWIPNADGYGGGENGTRAAYAAAARLTMDMKSRRSKGTIPSDAAAAMMKEEAAWDEYNFIDKKIKGIEASAAPSIEELKKTAGKKLDGTPYPSDWYDAYIVEKGLAGKENAEAKLLSKYGEDWRYKLGIKTDFKTPMATVQRETGEWAGFKKKLDKNPEVVNLQQTIENKFKGSQFAYQNKATIFDRSKTELKQDVKTAFTAALTEQSLARPQSDAGDMKAWIADEAKEQAEDQYMAWQEYNGGKPTWWIGIQRGDKFRKVEVTQETFMQNRKLQEAIPNTEFQNMFGLRLGARGGKDTYMDDKDITINGGQVSAYPVYMRDGTIKYTSTDANGQKVEVEGKPVVQYHLEQPATAGGQYRMKLYITDGNTGKILLQGVSYPPADMVNPGITPAMTQEQVLQQIKTVLANPAYIQGYLDKYYNKK